jgi:hypothetical protein
VEYDTVALKGVSDRASPAISTYQLLDEPAGASDHHGVAVDVDGIDPAPGDEALLHRTASDDRIDRIQVSTPFAGALDE